MITPGGRCVITSGSSNTRGSAIRKTFAKRPRTNNNEHISLLDVIINTIDTREAAALIFINTMKPFSCSD